jgi:hypothetical protein
LTTLPDRYDRQVVDDGFGELSLHDVMVTLPDLRVVQLVPACAAVHSITTAMDKIANRIDGLLSFWTFNAP